jgi:hypothetical protein
LRFSILSIAEQFELAPQMPYEQSLNVQTLRPQHGDFQALNAMMQDAMIPWNH